MEKPYISSLVLSSVKQFRYERSRHVGTLTDIVRGFPKKKNIMLQNFIMENRYVSVKSKEN
jgi:hypothetical protein